MYEYRIKEVDRVVDGDTIDVTIDLGFDILYKTRVRLYGINTPESRTRDLEEKERGLAAKERLSELINENPDLLLRTSKKGKFGRYLGELVIRKENTIDKTINDILVEEGHAQSYYGGKR